MKTFSVPPTETNELPDIVDILNILPDNTTKLISPKDVRDAVYTIWQNTMFKPTSISQSNISYIGIDQYQLTDDNENNWYPKVFFGKKQTGGKYIMSDSLLSQNEADFFFYHTRNTSITNDYSTSVAFLSGTGSFNENSLLKAPYIQSQPVTDANGSYMNMNIKNTSYYTIGLTGYGGNINIRSEWGNVSLNSLILPTSKTMTDMASNINKFEGYVLAFTKDAVGNPVGVWRSPFSQSVTSFTTNQNYTITSPLITLNGFKFIDSNIVTQTIGGIRQGESFGGSGIEVLDLLRRIVYSYVAPRIRSKIVNKTSGNPISLVEEGDNITRSNIRLRPTVGRFSTYSIVTIGYGVGAGNPTVTSDTPPQDFPSPVSSIPFDQTDTEYSYNILQSDYTLTLSQNYKIITYTLSCRDSFPTGVTASSTIKVVLPYFYGSATYAATQSISGSSGNINNILGQNENAPGGKLNQYLTEPIIGTPTISNNQYLRLTTSGLPNDKGFLYFGYPAGYPLLKRIYNGPNDVITAFQTYSISITSKNNFWSSRNYIFYISSETTVGLTAPTFSFLFQI